MTTKISAIIAQYIGQETRIIIPEVGTLIRRKESGEIIFMEMLRKNDGALIQLIVNALDVSPSKATEITNRYIGTIKQQLENNKKFIIDGVGVLLARAEGGIDFSFNPFAKSLPEPTPSAKPVGTPVARPVNPIPPVQRPATPVTPVTPAPQPKPATPVAPAPQPKPAAPAAPAPQPKPAAPVAQPKKEVEAPKAEEAKVEAPKAEAPKKAPAQAPKKPATKAAPKLDLLTIFAIVAAAMALFTLIWGFSASSVSAPKEEKQEYNQPTTLDEAIDSKALYQG